jgi:hypothetical protein
VKVKLVETLRRWLERAPDDDLLRLRLADRLNAMGEYTQALEEYSHLAVRGALPESRIPTMAWLAAIEGHVPLARQVVATARRAGLAAHVAELETRLDRISESPGEFD